jgi:hypothetical protein
VTFVLLRVLSLARPQDRMEKSVVRDHHCTPVARHDRRHRARLDRGRLMPRFQMDDSLYDDPAVSRAGTAAFGLYARCGDYVARHLLDGVVPSEIAAQYGTPEWTRKLTDAGLWEDVPGGHFMPRYLKDNPSRAKVEQEREAKAERQRKWLEKQRNPSSEPRRVSRRSSRQSDGTSRDASGDSPLPPSLTGRKGPAPARRGAGAAPEHPLMLATDQHPFDPDKSGLTCAVCGLQALNQRHDQAVSA